MGVERFEEGTVYYGIPDSFGVIHQVSKEEYEAYESTLKNKYIITHIDRKTNQITLEPIN